MKKNLLLYLAILIPTLMIITTAINVIYFNINKIPAQNFLYTILQNSSQQICATEFKSKILFPEYNDNHPGTHTIVDCSTLPIYLYDFNMGSSKTISLSQAKSLLGHTHKLYPPTKREANDLTVSTDGYKIKTYCQKDFGLVWFADQSADEICLVKDHYQKPLNISAPNGAYNFIFITWVKQ